MGAHMCRRIAPRDRELSIPSLSYGDRSRFRRMERAGNGASGKRCDIDGVTRTGELAGVSESNRDIDGQPERARERARIRRAGKPADSNYLSTMLPRPFKDLEWHKRKKHRHRRLSLLLRGLLATSQSRSSA